MLPMATWGKPKIDRQDKWKHQQEDTIKENRGRKHRKIHHNMDKPGWKHKETNRLHNDQRQIQAYGEACANKYLLEFKYAPEQETSGADNAALLQQRQEV